jgi:hypothetical protein
MKTLYDEVAQRFPEIGDRFRESDKELPYLIIGYLADWLKRLPNEAITPQLVGRLVSFARWCEKQPRGKDAGDDLYTVLTVGFYEPLFDKDETRALVPRFISREQFVAGADYLRAWVGAENYEKAGKYYDPPA